MVKNLQDWQDEKDEMYNKGFDNVLAEKPKSNPYKRPHVCFFSYELGYISGKKQTTKST